MFWGPGGGDGGAGPTMRGRSMTPHEGEFGEDGWSGDVQPLTSLPQCLKRLSKT